MKRCLRLIVPLITIFALAGCMLVNDFSPEWEKAKTDSCTSKIAESLYYSEFRRDPQGKDMKELARTMTLGKEHFLLLKQDASDKGGRMYRFRVINGIFQRFRLNPTMRKAFEIAHPDAPVSLQHDTVELKNLDENVTKLLSEIAANPDYWEIDDQTLYNTMLNPACLYEDRDLEAVANKRKKK